MTLTVNSPLGHSCEDSDHAPLTNSYAALLCRKQPCASLLPMSMNGDTRSRGKRRGMPVKRLPVTSCQQTRRFLRHRLISSGSTKRGLTCKMPFNAQNEQNHAMDVPNPKSTFTTAVAMSPPASMTVGELRAPSTPEMNLLIPYAMGKMDVRLPTCRHESLGTIINTAIFLSVLNAVVFTCSPIH